MLAANVVAVVDDVAGFDRLGVGGSLGGGNILTGR